MKKILVPVDFSDASLNALSYAIQLFKGQPLEVTILHTYNLMGSSAFTMKMNSIKRVMKEDAEKAMNGLLKKMEIEEPDVTFNSKIINNNATSTITLMGDSGIYDCIVMGTKGASGLKEVFIGSVAGWVISKTKAPVIIVPKSFSYRPLQQMVFAIGDHPLTDESVVKPLIDLAKMCGCKLNVLHIMKNHDPIPDDFMNAIEQLNPTVTYAPDEGDINKCMNNFIKDNDADILCLIRCKKGLFQHLFIESVTLKQTFHTTVPLLVLHDG